MHVVLVETSGNQDYIFASNKLREAVGASELVHRCGTRWALEAVGRAGGPALGPADPRASDERHDDDPDALRAALLDATGNAPIESGQAPVEIVHATSGKALMLVADADTGREVIRHVTRRALAEAPGLDVCGVVGEAFDWRSDKVAQAVARAHELHALQRRARPQPPERFPRLPPVASCASTSMPAAALETDADGKAPYSRVAIAKRAARRDATSRLDHLGAGVGLAYDINDLVDRLDGLEWVAVAHADGNGLGTVFTEFHEYVAAGDREPNRAYVEDLRAFSLAIDACTHQAFRSALQHLRQDDRWAPVVPLVVGGDDLTVLCEGRAALGFTVAYLRAFERATGPGGLEGAGGTGAGRLRDIVPDIMRRAQGTPRIGCSAGVAVVKPHFPFREAYDLAEQLTRSAKRVKDTLGPACTAADFHVAFDSTDLDLDRIREKPALTMRPYVVTPKADLADAPEDWRLGRHWEDLDRWAGTLRSKDEDGRRALPNSQLHALRDALHRGVEAAHAHYRLVRDRYAAMRELSPDGGDSLFLEDGDGQRTGVLDAMEVVALEGLRPPGADDREPAATLVGRS